MNDKTYSKGFVLELYRKMVTIRKFEERIKYLFLEGIMPGTIHQYQGQEACAVGVCSALKEGDIITSTHRPHGHALARGLSIQEILDELFGKSTGCCKGKGGSMHLGNFSKGMIPAIAIVGGSVPIATGIALGYKMKKTPGVAVCFMGDGAVNEGAFHEGVNMGALWNLPIIYVIENNLYGASTPVNSVIKTGTISERAAAYGIPGITIDGNDVLKVYETAVVTISDAREGKGPVLLELLTYRITGHSRRDPALYQPEAEKRNALENEPIRRFEQYLISRNDIVKPELEAIQSIIDNEIETAVTVAQTMPDPKPEDTFEDVFVEKI
jgi:pyruvate dehydrogenase E1 component alpha subunit